MEEKKKLKLKNMKSGIELIAIERQEQIEKHGRTIESDAEINKNGEMINCALQLIAPVPGFGAKYYTKEGLGFTPPKGWDELIMAKMINKSKIERLIIAGALIAAEIDRLLNATPEIKAQ